MKGITAVGLKDFLDEKVLKYNQLSFIDNDPISVPHQFRKKQDVEIAGLFAAVLAWGQRTTIIRKSNELMRLFDNSPHEFVLHHSDKDLKRMAGFKHRTFNWTDTLYFIHFLKSYYQKNETLENIFLADDIRSGIVRFHEIFFSLPEAPARSRKHLPNPDRKSACKRINMFLRWMVRQDNSGVDFGIWKRIPTNKLICPCDLHVERVARKLKLLKRTQLDWQAAEELTANLRKFDPGDPVKYDFALFGLGIEEKF